jgi:hypothetical protein
MANTILLKGRGIRKEAVAGGTITPGDLLTINSSGNLIRHATASGAAAPLFAVENDLVGLTIDDNYDANDYVQSEYLFSGCEVLTNVAAAAAAIVIGDLLEADGAGGVRKLTNGVVIAQAIQAVDNSAGGSRARIQAVIV